MDLENNNLDMKQLFFNNLILLGFDVQEMEATHSIPFNKAMFELPNKRAAEIVLHFLFQRLNPTMCREAFRDSWPIHDKKREQTFRKTCCNWLSNILQEEPDSHLPRINASMFMSPGGEKFYQLLFYFSGYVMQKVMEIELGVKSSERQKCPVVTPQNVNMQDSILKSLKCSGIRHRKQYFETVNMNVQASEMWKQCVDEYVREYRKLHKDLRELDYKIRDEEHRAHKAAEARGSPTKKRSSTDHFDPEFDPRTIKRSQRIQQVRDMWKTFEDFDRSKEAEQDVVASIVDGKVNKHRIDGSSINVKVPDMVLRECHDEIVKRNVGNTYQGGKLSLEALLQLWNLSLHLVLEKLKQVGVPQFEEEVQKLTPQVHVQQNFTQLSQTLREQMSQKIPEMKASVHDLRNWMDNKFFQDVSPESIRSTSLGVGLVKPSPKLNFSPGAATTPTDPLSATVWSKQELDTPVAAQEIAEELKERARKGPQKLFKEPDLLHKAPDWSSIPRPSTDTGSRQSSRPTSARSNPNTGGKSSFKSTPKSSKIGEKDRKKASLKATDDKSFQKPTSPRTLVESVPDGALKGRARHSKRKEDASDTSLPLSSRSGYSSDRTLTERSIKSSPRSERSFNNRELSDIDDNRPARRNATDILVDEIMGEAVVLSPFNSGLEAFHSNQLVSRTPEIDAELPECVTPANSEEMFEPKQEEEQIVNIMGPELNEVTPRDKDDAEDGDDQRKTVESILARAGQYLKNRRSDSSQNNSRIKLELHVDSIQVTDKENEIQGGKMVIEANDEEVNEMILEGIRQATEDDDEEGRETYEFSKQEMQSHREGFYEEDEEGIMDQKLEDDAGADMEFEEIAGPDLEEEDLDKDSEGSVRSTEDVIVIDKSIHRSPHDSTHVSPREAYPVQGYGEELIEDEQFPEGLESSPGTAIIIDRSYQFTASNRAGLKSTQPHDMLSRSLGLERSPLSDEIRKMFQKAVADTPPKPSIKQYFQKHAQLEDDLDIPDMDLTSRINDHGKKLKAADISWDIAENLEDIEQPPDIDLDKDTDIDDIVPKDGTGSQDDSLGIINIGDQDDDNIDEFFAVKTPELPTRWVKGQEDRLSSDHGQGDASRLLSSDGIKWPTAGDDENIETTESPLIAFTP